MQNKSRRTFAAENKEISLLDKKSLKKFRQTKTNFVSFLYASKLQWDVQSLTRSQFNKTILLVFVIFLQIGNLQKNCTVIAFGVDLANLVGWQGNM